MASSNTVKLYGHIMEWGIQDASGNAGTSGSLHWWSTAGGDNTPGPGDTDSWWMVKTITYIPPNAQTTGGYVRLVERDSSGPTIFQATFETAVDVYTQTYDPPLRCRPAWWSSLSDGFATGGKWVFHLA